MSRTSNCETCEMCGNERATSISWSTRRKLTVRVGCVCAEKMTEDLVNPMRREKRLRNRFARRKKWLERSWAPSKRGREYLTVGHNHIVIFRRGGDGGGEQRRVQEFVVDLGQGEARRVRSHLARAREQIAGRVSSKASAARGARPVRATRSRRTNHMTKAQLAVAKPPALGRLLSVRSSLRARFLERDHIIDLILAAVVSKLHVFLLGPPGTKTFCTFSPTA